MASSSIPQLKPLQEMVQGFASRNQVALIKRKPIQTLLEEEKSRCTSAYEIEGAFDNLLMFIHMVEGAPPPWQIKEIRVSKGTGITPDQAMKMDFLLEIPFTDLGYP